MGSLIAESVEEFLDSLKQAAVAISNEAELRERLLEADAARSPYAILMVPLLVEAGSYRKRVNRIAVVDCAEATQIARVMRRNGLARTEIEGILAAQATRAERLAAADDVIDNDGDLSALPPQIDRLHVQYLAYARQLD